MKNLARYFLRGSLVLVPLVSTIYIVYLIVAKIDSVLPFAIPGLGFVVTVAIVTLTGFFASNVAGKTAIGIAEGYFTRLPLIKLLYTSIKDLIGAFVGDQRRFNQPVAVSLASDEAVKLLGFVTRTDLSALELPGHVAVYFPQSYNFAGNLVLVPRERVVPIATASSEVMTFIVSGGVSGLGVGQSLPQSVGGITKAEPA